MRVPGSHFLVFAAVAVAVSSSTLALAQGPDVAGAETLFERGRQLMAEGNFKEACPKFAESERLAPSAGTALNLASCYEKLGKTASAWGMYREAISLSVASGQAVREQFARDRATELEAKLMKLVVSVGSDEPNLEIKRDGVAVARAQWGTPIPIDPGAHVIEASAPKKIKWTKNIESKAPGQTTSVTIPGLQDAPPDAVPEPTSEKPRGDGGGTLRVVGFIGMGVGAALLGAGGFFALSSQSKKDDIESAAGAGEAWSADRQGTFDDGESQATLANVFFISGGAVLATGAVLAVLGYSPKNDSGKAPRRSGPSFAGASLGPRGGTVGWTF
jgi:tetratricopeptide (TPR) repeat protein